MTYIVEVYKKSSSDKPVCTEYDCQKEIEESSYWNIDGSIVCDDCRDGYKYSDLVKCETDGCNNYERPGVYTDGLCDSCEERISPPDPTDDGSDD